MDISVNIHMEKLHIGTSHNIDNRIFGLKFKIKNNGYELTKPEMGVLKTKQSFKFPM